MNTVNKILLCFATLSLLFFSCLVNAETGKTYTGTVVPIFKTKINAGSGSSYWGSLEFAAHLGELTTPEITNLTGKVIEDGTILINMRQQYWYGQVLVSRGELLSAKKDLETATENLKRYKTLYPSGAVPVRKFQETRATYYEKLSAYKKALASLIENKRVLQESRQFSQLEGIVDKVYYTRGLLTSDPKVIDLIELNPIGIKVKMHQDEANEIKIDTPITIYTQNGNKLGIYNCYSILCNDGIIFPTRNTPKRNTDKKVIRIKDCFPVVRFFIGKQHDNTLGVPFPALLKDERGYYVWRAKNRKFMQPGKGLNPVFQVEKIYVIPDNLKRLYNGITYMRGLKKPGKLELYDVVVSPGNKKLHEGDTVSFPPERYNLMPGDKVKVVIGIENNINSVNPADSAKNLYGNKKVEKQKTRHHRN